jgi:ribonuclease-3
VRKNRSVLADACEALIGAVFVDAGYPAARAVVENALSERMKAFRKPPSNPKAVLQEWALARGLGVPAYTVVEQFGPDHAPRFRISVSVEGSEPATGQGTSKRAAEQDAAQNLLVREGIWEAPQADAVAAALTEKLPPRPSDAPLEIGVDTGPLPPCGGG